MAAASYSQVPRSAWHGVETVYLPCSGLDAELLDALFHAVPHGETFGFNHDHQRAWVTVSKPGNTREVLAAALRSLDREWPAEP